jgi:hypothetical protein
LNDASAQDFFGVLPMPLGGVMSSGVDWSGFAGYGQPYLGPMGSNYYNMPDILPLSSYNINSMTPSGLYQGPGFSGSYSFNLMAFTPGYPYMNNINSLLPNSIFQTNQRTTGLSMSSYTPMPLQMFDPWIMYYSPTTTSWALNTQSIYNPTPWDIYPTYFATPYDYSYDYNYDDSYYDDSSPALYGKPAIYLYPEEDTNVIVYLDLNGEITQSDPDYQGGWNVFVTVTEDSTTKYSTIYDENGSEYDYLFWEGAFEYSSLVLPNTGWIVARENLETWFDEKLNAMGLNNYEKQQFMEYWVARLQDSPYYEIKLVDQEVMNNNATLSITTSEGAVPDTLIRIIVHFHGVDVNEYIEAPQIVTPERNGFVVVEWGGILH